MQSGNNQPDKSNSPDRVREFRATGKIDRLVRENIKKLKSKEDEEKLLRLQQEEDLKRKRDLLEFKNNMVRRVNKEKTYRKQNHIHQ